jgi:DNA polymerase-4
LLPGNPERVILHVDADCFYVSCHVAREPARLAGLPVAVAGDPTRRAGVVLSASYEARTAGLRAGMSLAEALRLCPHLVVLRPEFDLYRGMSTRLHALLAEWSPLVEPLSVDEAWLDVTGCPAGACPIPAARALQRRVRAELGLPVSVGIGPNKLLAKMASALSKPGGVLELRRADVPARLWPLPVDRLLGVGPALAGRLARWNVRTIGDLAALGPAFCERHLGRTGLRLWQAACGRDDSPVDPRAGAHPRSLGCSVTLPQDVRDVAEARRVLLGLADRLARRLRTRGLVALALAVHLRDHAFRNHTRSAALAAATDMAPELCRAALDLARPLLESGRRFRLLGLVACKVAVAAETPRPLSLFDRPADLATAARLRSLHRTADAVRERFGQEALQPALLTAGSHPGRRGPRRTG